MARKSTKRTTQSAKAKSKAVTSESAGAEQPEVGLTIEAEGEFKPERQADGTYGVRAADGIMVPPLGQGVVRTGLRVNSGGYAVMVQRHPKLGGSPIVVTGASVQGELTILVANPSERPARIEKGQLVASIAFVQAIPAQVK